MNAHIDTNHHWTATYEVRDQHGQILHDAYTVQVQADTKMGAMLLAADKVLDETKAVNAVCRAVRRV